jgi:hypothetical protein
MSIRLPRPIQPQERLASLDHLEYRPYESTFTGTGWSTTVQAECTRTSGYSRLSTDFRIRHIVKSECPGRRDGFPVWAASGPTKQFPKVTFCGRYAPKHPGAYANFLKRLALFAGNRIHYYEIWNEPNLMAANGRPNWLEGDPRLRSAFGSTGKRFGACAGRLRG